MIDMQKIKKQRRKTLIKNKLASFFIGFFRYALIICLSYLILSPLLKNLSTAFTFPSELGLQSSVWVPRRSSIENWHVAAIALNYSKTLPYSLIQCFIIALCQLIAPLFAAYAFARLRLPFKRTLFACVIITIVVSPQIFMLPQYLHFRNFDMLGLAKLITGKPINLLGHPASLLLLNALGQGLKGGLFIYIFRQTFLGLPKALEEAAYIDGAGFLRTFFKIVLPSASSSILTVMVLSFVWNWNDSYYIRLLDPQNTGNIMLSYTRAAASVDQAVAAISTKIPESYTVLMKNPVYEQAIGKTMTLLIIIPLVILYLFIQRRFIQGVERSGITGM